LSFFAAKITFSLPIIVFMHFILLQRYKKDQFQQNKSIVYGVKAAELISI